MPKKGMKRKVSLSVVFEGRHISILDIYHLKSPIAFLIQGKYYVFLKNYLTNGLVTSKEVLCYYEKVSCYYYDMIAKYEGDNKPKKELLCFSSFKFFFFMH